MTHAPFLPDDGYAGTLLTRIWNPHGIGGPSVAVVREDGIYDLSAHVPTMSTLLEMDEPVVWVRSWAGQRVGSLDAVLANSTETTRDASKPFFLSPCDLQVGTGLDAEVFTTAPVLSSVGTGSDVGIRADAHGNHPQPEVVLAGNSQGLIQGVALGNRASCAIGPFIRLFDETFTLDHVRSEVVQLEVRGEDGFVMHGTNSMDQISRDPLELVQQTLGAHQYPDGFMLFMGTLFAPTQDRDQAGGGFTHHVGDTVCIRSLHLGALHNRVVLCEDAAPWEFGLRAFFNNLAARGLLTPTLL